jgi:hypothetical protein
LRSAEQYPVPDRVAVRVVDRLEVVDVEHRQRERGAGLAGRVE